MHAAEQLQVNCFRAGVPPRHWQLPQREHQKGKGQGIPPLLLNESTTPPLLPDLWLSCSTRLIRLLIDIHSILCVSFQLSPLSFLLRSHRFLGSFTQSFWQMCDCVTTCRHRRDKTLHKVWPLAAESLRSETSLTAVSQWIFSVKQNVWACFLVYLKE